MLDLLINKDIHQLRPWSFRSESATSNIVRSSQGEIVAIKFSRAPSLVNSQEVLQAGTGLAILQVAQSLEEKAVEKLFTSARRYACGRRVRRKVLPPDEPIAAQAEILGDIVSDHWRVRRLHIMGLVGEMLFL
ncbi:hypothetical protein E4U32_005568 [Claviceps aff. humidiphila group G2b]|nr:hypothetical protein E4U32_005568 [Claviceps aff. humidiphila group G2b]